MSICIQKIKDRYQYNQEILKIKEHSNLIDSEHALVCPFQKNMFCFSLSTSILYPLFYPKYQSQI